MPSALEHTTGCWKYAWESLIRDTLWPKCLLRQRWLRAPLQSTDAEGRKDSHSPRRRSRADRARTSKFRSDSPFGEGEVVDPLLKVPRSRLTTQVFGWAVSAKTHAFFAPRVPRHLSISSSSTNVSPASSGLLPRPSRCRYRTGAAASCSQFGTSHTALEDMVLQSTSFNDAAEIQMHRREDANIPMQRCGCKCIGV